MEDVKAIELIGKLTERFTRTCPPTPEYQSRLAEEFEIILDLRFVDYFLQIRDILDLTQDGRIYPVHILKDFQKADGMTKGLDKCCAAWLIHPRAHACLLLYAHTRRAVSP